MKAMLSMTYKKIVQAFAVMAILSLTLVIAQPYSASATYDCGTYGSDQYGLDCATTTPTTVPSGTTPVTTTPSGTPSAVATPSTPIATETPTETTASATDESTSPSDVTTDQASTQTPSPFRWWLLASIALITVIVTAILLARKKTPPAES